MYCTVLSELDIGLVTGPIIIMDDVELGFVDTFSCGIQN
jgi:hypothetical protein